MGQRRDAGTRGAEQTVRDIRRATRRKFSAEEKIRIVLEGLRGEDSIAALTNLCSSESILSAAIISRWSTSAAHRMGYCN